MFSSYTIVPMTFETSKGQIAFLFLSWLFFFVKKFQLHYKGSILHLKLGGSGRSSYFPTSTLSEHTPHHHGQPITSNRLLK
jgi:hypothetical protein